MTSTWILVVGVGLATIAIKALGPLLLGGRPLPGRVAAVVQLLAPAVLSALVVTQTFGDGRSLVLDARVVGLGAAVVALRLRAPVLVVVVVAAATTALVRAVS
ncbi:MAG TPA: AzlD domain-containing protein [Actinomycetota bacterium]|jgi:branched-subunit amino acid transport protein|nr:AzlD domain-containing protein [Actinomycetota bacterium]